MIATPTSNVGGWFAPARLQPYLQAASGDPARALDLYVWSTALSAACFETMSHVEVILRHAVDSELRQHFEEASCGIPWFLRPVAATTKAQARIDEDIELTRRRLRALHRETRDQIIAGLSFGFWSSLLHGDHEQLWRDSLRKAFPHSSGKRKDVAAVVEPLRVFRNRLAHHDSLLSANVLFQRDQLLRLVGWIDTDAATWLKRHEKITSAYLGRPFAAPDTVVVAAKEAWQLYLQTSAYVCQPGRAFQTVEYMAFYSGRAIKCEVAKILDRIDNVPWTSAEAGRLQNSPDAQEQRLAAVMSSSIAAGWTEGRYQVFFLTAPGQIGHITLPHEIAHLAKGAGSAFTQRQRYVSHRRLLSAGTTSDLTS